MSLVKWIAAAGIPVVLIAAIAIMGGKMSDTAGRLEFMGWKLVPGKANGGRFVTVNDARIYIETFGHGPPVLVLHGGLASLEGMGHQIRALAASHLVIAADSRGHGRSTGGDGPLSYALMADDMAGILDQLKIGPVDVVGWSDGGIVGLDLAMHHPAHVRRLVAISANFDVSGLAESPAPAGQPPCAGACTQAAPPHPETFHDKVVALWRTQPHYSLAELGLIHAPTLVMAGEFDVITRTHTDQLTKAIPGAREAIIAGATHTLIDDEPALVNTAILRFLDQP